MMSLPNRSNTDFGTKLVKAVKSIKKAANGRVCGDCVYCIRTLCVYPWDWKGANLELIIYTPQAVACKRWKAK